jgi:hypothetical protein
MIGRKNRQHPREEPAKRTHSLSAPVRPAITAQLYIARPGRDLVTAPVTTSANIITCTAASPPARIKHKELATHAYIILVTTSTSLLHVRVTPGLPSIDELLSTVQTGSHLSSSHFCPDTSWSCLISAVSSPRGVLSEAETGRNLQDDILCVFLEAKSDQPKFDS